MTEEKLPSTDLITLTRYVFIAGVCVDIVIDSRRHILAEQHRLGASATGDLTMLLNAIELTSKFISNNVRKARLLNL